MLWYTLVDSVSVLSRVQPLGVDAAPWRDTTWATRKSPATTPEGLLRARLLPPVLLLLFRSAMAHWVQDPDSEVGGAKVAVETVVEALAAVVKAPHAAWSEATRKRQAIGSASRARS